MCNKNVVERHQQELFGIVRSIIPMFTYCAGSGIMISLTVKFLVIIKLPIYLYYDFRNLPCEMVT